MTINGIHFTRLTGIRCGWWPTCDVCQRSAHYMCNEDSGFGVCSRDCATTHAQRDTAMHAIARGTLEQWIAEGARN